MTLERGTRARVVTLLVLLLVLSAGFVMGVAMDRQVLASRLTERDLRGSEGRVQGVRGERAGEPRDSLNRRRPLLVEQVGLSEVQKAQVDSILAFWQREMRSLQRQTNEAYEEGSREILARTRNSWREVLTDEQKTAYDSLLVDFDRRRAERRNRDSLPDGRGSSQRRP